MHRLFHYYLAFVFIGFHGAVDIVKKFYYAEFDIIEQLMVPNYYT